jgi:hypothetical protein
MTDGRAGGAQASDGNTSPRASSSLPKSTIAEVAARAEILREVGGNLTPAEGVEISNLIAAHARRCGKDRLLFFPPRATAI